MVKRILLADDNQTYRQTQLAQLERLCSNLGIDAEFDEASDGRELVEKVLGNSYDLVFTDNQMPEVHGLLAIRQIRGRDITTPIYMISSSEVGRQAVEVGATGYIEKQNYDLFKSGIENALREHLK